MASRRNQCRCSSCFAHHTAVKQANTTCRNMSWRRWQDPAQALHFADKSLACNPLTPMEPVDISMTILWTASVELAERWPFKCHAGAVNPMPDTSALRCPASQQVDKHESTAGACTHAHPLKPRLCASVCPTRDPLRLAHTHCQLSEPVPLPLPLAPIVCERTLLLPMLDVLLPAARLFSIAEVRADTVWLPLCMSGCP